MPKSVTEIVTEIVTESDGEWRRYDCSTGTELPTVWGNVRCIDRVGSVGWCNRTCDGRSVWRSMWRSMVVWERQFWGVSPNKHDAGMPDLVPNMTGRPCKVRIYRNSIPSKWSMFDPDPTRLYITICRPHQQFARCSTQPGGFAEWTFDMFTLFWASVGSLEVPGL